MHTSTHMCTHAHPTHTNIYIHIYQTGNTTTTTSIQRRVSSIGPPMIAENLSNGYNLRLIPGFFSIWTYIHVSIHIYICILYVHVVIHFVDLHLIKKMAPFAAPTDWFSNYENIIYCMYYVYIIISTCGFSHLIYVCIYICIYLYIRPYLYIYSYIYRCSALD